MSFWMYHSNEYDGAYSFKRGRIISATIATGVILLLASFIVVPMIYIFSGCKFDKDTFFWFFGVFEIIVFILFCTHLELFRKIYEGLRMYSGFKEVLQYAMGTNNIIFWYPRNWR